MLVLHCHRGQEITARTRHRLPRDLDAVRHRTLRGERDSRHEIRAFAKVELQRFRHAIAAESIPRSADLAHRPGGAFDWVF